MKRWVPLALTLLLPGAGQFVVGRRAIGAALMVWSLAFFAYYGVFAKALVPAVTGPAPEAAAALLGANTLLLAQYAALVVGSAIDVRPSRVPK